MVLRQEIRRRLWPDNTIVEFDHSINAAIKRLRNALGESAEAPRYIETLAKRGYRFLGAVERVGVPLSESAPEAHPNGHSQSARDAKGELGRIPETAPADRPAPARFRWGGPSLWMGVVVFAILLAAFIAPSLRKKPAEAPLVRFSVFPPENTVFGNSPGPAVSPDGRRIVFATLPTSGEGWQLWLRSLDAVAPVPLAGTEQGSLPFWSPDGRSIAFFADGKLKRIDLDAPSGRGQAVTLCTVEGEAGGTWNRDGVILFGTSRGALYRVPDTGGSPTPATKLDEARQENSHDFPWFLPDGHHFLFEAVSRPLPPDHVTIRVGLLDSGQSKVLLEADSNAIFAQSRLIYVGNNTLLAQPFDARHLMTTGEPALAAGLVAVAGILDGLGSFSASENGPLVYFAGAGEPPFELLWFDRQGNRLSAVRGIRIIDYFLNPLALSPDQRTIALANRELSNTAIWLQDVAQGLRTRFTFDPANEIAPVWSPDSRTIAFSSSRKGHFDLYRRAADGSEPEQLLLADNHDKYASSWSADGKFLLYDSLQDQRPRSSIWVLPLTAEQSTRSKPFPFLQTSASEGHAQFSPDRRWIAYESEESGRREIYLVPFGVEGADAAWKRQISTAGGGLARWRRDGREIFYRSGRRLMAAPINVKAMSVQVGEARQVIGRFVDIGLRRHSRWAASSSNDAKPAACLATPDRSSELDGSVEEVASQERSAYRAFADTFPIGNAARDGGSNDAAGSQIRHRWKLKHALKVYDFE